MINRVLIRIRIVQVLYSYYQNEDGNIKRADSELHHSFQKSYDLYFYLLLLLVEITDAYFQRVESAKLKHLPTREDMNPNMKLLDNKFVEQLRNNPQLLDYLKERPFTWNDNDTFIRSLLNEILESKAYTEYLEQDSSYENDREFWRKVFKQIISKSEDLDAILEDESIYWNDDVEIVKSFVLKTIKKTQEDGDPAQAILPMFKDSSDHEFAVKLLRDSILEGKHYRDMIGEYAQNWESDRIAFMDQLIMQIAIAEIVNFPSIPINVTLNEYIDVSKSYSTEKSGSFINGILDSIVEKLRNEKKIIK